MNYDNKDIERRLQTVLSPHRYKHTVGVACTTIPLSMQYGGDVERTELAGLLHDCAKAYSDEEQLKKCIENNIELTDIEQKNLNLIHAKLGVFLAKNEYGIEDTEVLNAIKYHTTGKPDMTLMEKIVFVSDYIEPGRNKAPNLPEIRKTAFRDIDDAVFYIMRDTLLFLYMNNPFMIDNMTKDAFEYYKGIFHEKHKKEEI